MKLTSLKKAVFATILITISSMPVSTQAFWGVGDITLDPANLGQSIANVLIGVQEYAAKLQQMLKTFGLDAAFNKLKQKAIQSITAKALNSVNGGASMNKPPNYVENFPQYFSDIVGKATSTYTTELFGSSSPFGKDISAFIVNQASGFVKNELDQFTLEKVLPEGVKWRDAAKDLYLAGNKGLDFYVQLALPQNTPGGASLIAQQQLAKKIADQAKIASIELTSTGFKPKKILDGLNGVGKDVTGVDFAKLSSELSDVAKKKRLDKQGKDGTLLMNELEQNQALDDMVDIKPDYDPNENDEGIEIKDILMESYASDETKKDVASPQATVADNTNQAKQNPLDLTKMSNQFFEILFGSLTTLLNGAIDKGIAKIGSDAGASSKYKYGSQTQSIIASSGANSNWLASPQEILDFRNELGIAYQRTRLDAQYQEEILSLLKDPVNGKVLNSKEISENKTGISPQHKGTDRALQKLEFCIPGPDSFWEERLQIYVKNQTRATTERGGSDDGDKATENNKVISLISRQTQEAIQRTKLMMRNPMLNIPGATELQLIATSYYKNSQQFQGVFNRLMLKKTTMSELNAIILQIKGMSPDLVLFDDQWNALSDAQKETKYRSIIPDLLKNFADTYGELMEGVPADTDNPATVDIDESLGIKIKSLPIDNPTTNENERLVEMKKRFFDQQWYTWETTPDIKEEQRQDLYQRFTAQRRNITDADSLQDIKGNRDSIEKQNVGIADALHDCQIIRDATKTYPNPADPAWNTVKNNIFTERVKSFVVPATSILGTNQNTSIQAELKAEFNKPMDEDNDAIPQYGRFKSSHVGCDVGKHACFRDSFSNLSTSTMPGSSGSGLKESQVKLDLIFQQPTPQMKALVFLTLDENKRLFCGLFNYHLFYFGPSPLTGLPIGCSEQSMILESARVRETSADWYHINVGEIFYAASDMSQG